MAPLGKRYPSILCQTFVIEIANRPLVSSFFPFRILGIFLSCSRLRANTPVAAVVTRHTCSLTRMEMTELQEGLEVSVLSALLPLGNFCPYRLESLREPEHCASSVQVQIFTSISRQEVQTSISILSSSGIPSV